MFPAALEIPLVPYNIILQWERTYFVDVFDKASNAKYGSIFEPLFAPIINSDITFPFYTYVGKSIPLK